MLSYTETIGNYTQRYEAESVVQLMELIQAVTQLHNDQRRTREEAKQSAPASSPISNKWPTPPNWTGPKPPPGYTPEDLCKHAHSLKPEQGYAE